MAVPTGEGVSQAGIGERRTPKRIGGRSLCKQAAGVVRRPVFLFRCGGADRRQVVLPMDRQDGAMT
jgi:hypothetical protein